MENASPYEYHNGVLGVHMRCLCAGSKAHVDTLALINCDALQKRIARGNITMLRKGGWNNNALIKYDSLPQSWQDLLVRKFGEPKRMVTFE